MNWYKKYKIQNASHQKWGVESQSFVTWFIGKIDNRIFHYIKRWVHKKQRIRGELYDQQWVLNTLKPSVFIDVGANVGYYPIQLLKTGFTGKIIAIEPVRHVFKTLKKHADNGQKFTAINAGVSDTSGSMTLYVCGTGGGQSSYLPPTEYLEYNSKAKIEDTYETDIVTLSQIIEQHVPNADNIYIKIDVQGLEKKVIQGAKQHLSKVIGCKLEMAVNNSDYEDQPDMWEIIQYMKQQGFVLIHLEHTWRDHVSGTKEIIYMDGIFLNAKKMHNK